MTSRCHNRSASALALAIGLFYATPATAQGVTPSGETVVRGSATVDRAGGGVTVNQTTERSVINWSTFNVGNGNIVTFNQPTAASITLNRVTGNGESLIDGRIQSNGAVYLINPNGIAIGQSGLVDTRGGFVASTLDINDDDFMGGRMNFAGGKAGRITNSGLINSDAYTVLLGGTVANSGNITVPLGRVAIGAGSAAALDLSGDGFLQVLLPSADSGSGALIDVSGNITSEGGRITLHASSATNAVREAVNLRGTLAANGATGRSGDIRLTSSGGGAINVTGSLLALHGQDVPAADGQPAGTITIAGSGAVNVAGVLETQGYAGGPGRIDITGQHVTIDGARIANHAGLIRIGGSYHYGAGDDDSAAYAMLTGRFASSWGGGLPEIATARTVTIRNSSLNQGFNFAAASLIVGSSENTEFSGTNSGVNMRAISISSQGTVSDFGLNGLRFNGLELMALGAASLSVRAGGAGVDGAISVINRDQLAASINSTGAAMILGASDTLEVTDGISMYGVLTCHDFGCLPGSGDLTFRAGRGVTLAGQIDAGRGNIAVVANDPTSNGGGRAAGAAFIDARAAVFGVADPNYSDFSGTEDGGNLSLSLLLGSNSGAGGQLHVGAINRNNYNPYTGYNYRNFTNLSLTAPGGSVIFHGDVAGYADAQHQAGPSQNFTLSGNLLFANNATITGRAGSFDWIDRATTTIGAFTNGQALYDYSYLIRAFDGSGFQTLASGRLSDAAELPTGGAVAAGSATIAAPTATTLTVTQSSQRAVIDWLTFGIGNGGTVRFNQPNSSAVILNRVTSKAASNIAGRLESNGAVFLINPNGVSIGATGIIDTRGGFVAASAGLSTSNFMAGNLAWSGSSAALMSNAGSITVGDAAAAMLLGGTVANAGTITTGAGGEIRLVATGTGTVSAGGTLSASALTLGARDVVIGAAQPGIAPGLALSLAEAANLFAPFSKVRIEAGNDLFLREGFSLGGATLTELGFSAGRSILGGGLIEGGGAALSLSANAQTMTVSASGDRGNGAAVLDLLTTNIRSSGTRAGDISLSLGAGGPSGGLVLLGGMNGGSAGDNVAAFGNLSIAAGTGGAIRFAGDVSTSPGNPAAAAGANPAAALSLTGSLQFASSATISSGALDWTDAGTTSVRGWGSGAPEFLANAALVSGGTTLFRGRLTDAFATRIDLGGLTGGATFQYGLEGSELRGRVLRVVSGALAPGDTLGTLFAANSIGVTGTDSGRLALGTYTVAVTGPTGGPRAGDKAGYFFDLRVPNTNAFEVVPRQLSYDIGAVTSIYGSAAVVAPVLQGVLSGDEVEGSLRVSNAQGIQTLSDRLGAGSYSLSLAGLSGAGASNYILAGSGSNNGTLTVTPKSLDFAGPTLASTYGSLAALGGGTFTGLLSGDDVFALLALNGASGGYAPTARLAAGDYTVVATGLGGAAAGNYLLGSQSDGQLRVNPLALTLALSDVQYRYGSPVAAATLSGVLSGDVVAPAATLDGVAVTLAAIGGALGLSQRVGAGSHALAVTGLTGASAGNYILSAPASATISILPRLLTWGFASDNSSTYGSTNFSAALTNVLTGDQVSAVTLATSSIGTTAPLTARTRAGQYVLGAGALGGADAANYAFADAGHSAGNLTIFRAPLTFKAAAVTSIYGTAAVLGAGNFTGLLSGDEVTAMVELNFTGGQPTARMNVGDYAIRAMRIAGADADNYQFFSQTADASTLTVLPRQLTATLANASYVYGSPSALVGLSGILDGDRVSPFGLVAGQEITLFRVGTGWGFGERQNVGTHSYRLTGLTGEESHNYVLAAAGDATAIITPRPLTWISGHTTDTYGNSNQSGAELAGVVALDSVAAITAVLDGSGNPVTDGTRLGAGSYGVAVTGLSGANADNYVLAGSGNTAGQHVVRPRPLDINIASASTIYGNLAKPTSTLFGVINSDQVAGLVGVFSGGNQVTLSDRLAAGRYDLLPAGLTGPGAANYTINSSVGTGFVLTVDQRPLNYSLANASSTYGTLASVDASLTGVLVGDEVDPQVSVLLSDGGSQLLSARTAAGTYGLAVTALGGASGANYRLGGGTNATIEISRKLLSFTIGDVRATYGDPLTQALGLNGILAGDDVTAAINLARDGQAVSSIRPDAGTYVASVLELTGDAAGNYLLDNSSSRTGTVVIDPRPVGLSGAFTTTYGTLAPLPSLVENTAYGQKVGFVPLLRNAAGENSGYSVTADAGDYTVGIGALTTLSDGVLLSNYVVDPSLMASLSILRRQLTGLHNTRRLERTYGDTSALTGGFTFFNLLQQDAGGVQLAYTVQGGDLSSSGRFNAGFHALQVAGITGDRAKNYEFVSRPGQDFLVPELLILRRQLPGYTLSGSFSRVYGNGDAPTAELLGVLAGDDVRAGPILLNGAGALVDRSEAGTYVVGIREDQLTGADARNYVGGTGFGQSGQANFVINRREVSFAATSLTQTYGEFALPGVVGALPGDDVSPLAFVTQGGGRLNPVSNLAAGNYLLFADALGGAAARNYTLTGAQLDGLLLTIVPRALNFAGTANIIYGDRFSDGGLLGLFSNLLASDATRISPAFLLGGQASNGQLANGSFLNVGGYTISLASIGGIAGGNYVIGGANSALVQIAPRVISGSLGAAHTYGSLNVSPDRSLGTSIFTDLNSVRRSSLVGSIDLPSRLRGDDVQLAAVAAGVGAVLPDRLNAGTYLLTTPALVGAAAGNYQLDPSFAASGSLVIKPRPIQITFSGPTFGEFGPNAQFNVTANPSLDVLAGDVITTSVKIGGKPNGIGLTPGVHAIEATLSGSSAGNYLVASAPGQFQLGPMKLTSQRFDVIYGGSAYNPLQLFSSGDNAFLALHGVNATATFDSIANRFGTVTLNGSNAGWFSLLDPRSLVNILPRPVHIGGTALTVTYGDTSTTSLLGVEIGSLGGESGLLPGDTIRREFAVRDVGTYSQATTDSFFSNSGRYFPIFNVPTVFKVVPRPISLRQLTTNKIYGDRQPLLETKVDIGNRIFSFDTLAPQYNVTGYAGPLPGGVFFERRFEGGSFANTPGSINSDEYANVGTYTFRVTSFGNPNFVPVDQEYTYTITPRLLTDFSSPSPTGLYGDRLTLLSFPLRSLTFRDSMDFNGRSSRGWGTLLENDHGNVTPIYESGSADFLAQTQGQFEVNRPGVKPLDVNTYTYTLTGLGGARGANYAIAPQTGSVTFTQRPFRYVIDTANRYYGDQTLNELGCLHCGMRTNPSAFYQPGPSVPLTDVSMSVSLIDGSGEPSSYSALTNAGDYTIRTELIGADAANYFVDPTSVTPTTLTVNRAILGYQISLGAYRSLAGNAVSYVRGLGFLSEFESPRVTLNGIANSDPVTVTIGLFPGTDTSVRTGPFYGNPAAAPSGFYHFQVASFNADPRNYQLIAPLGSFGTGPVVEVFDFTSNYDLAGLPGVNRPPVVPLTPGDLLVTPTKPAATGSVGVGSGSSISGEMGTLTSLFGSVQSRVAGALGFNPLNIASGSVSVGAEGTAATGLGTANMTATGSASVEANYSVSLGKVSADAGAGAYGAVRLDYGPGYSEIGGSATVTASVNVNLLSKNPAMVVLGGASAGAYVLTGVQGNIGGGVTGGVEGLASAGVSADGSAGFSYTDGKIKTGFSAGLQAGAEAGGTGEVTVGGVTTRAGGGVSVGTLSASVQPSAGYEDGKLSVGLDFDIGLGIGLSFSLDITIDFAAIGNAIKDAAIVAEDVLSRGLDNYLARQEAEATARRVQELRRQNTLAFAERLSGLDPLRDSEAIVNLANTTQNLLLPLPGPLGQLIDDARSLDRLKQENARLQQDVAFHLGVYRERGWSHGNELVRHLQLRQADGARIHEQLTQIGARYDREFRMTSSGQIMAVQPPSPAAPAQDGL